MVQVLGFLQSTWETQIEFLAPGLSLVYSQLLQVFEE